MIKSVVISWSEQEQLWAETWIKELTADESDSWKKSPCLRDDEDFRH